MAQYLAKETGEKPATVEKLIQRAKLNQPSKKDTVLSSLSTPKKECALLVKNCNDAKVLAKVQEMLM
jgi:hypothetical protein